MGLDMSLYAKRFDNQPDEGQEVDIISSEFEAIYWRKANAIHAWFVQNVQNGVDDCGAYPVSKNHLKELQITIKKIGKSRTRAMLLLPPTAGFFFGSTEMNEGYWEDLSYTREKIKSLLANDGYWVFFYSSSW